MKSGTLTSGGYSSPLRESQLAQTRSRILAAVAALIEAGREPTYAAIAEQAEVQERTVYRHFPTREELHRAFWQWVHQQHFSLPEAATDLGSLCAQVAQTFAGFSAHEALARAMLHSPEGRAIRLAANHERRERYSRVLQSEVPQLGPEQARRAAAAAQVLCSAMSWEYLRDYWGMDPREAAEAVHQALAAMFSGLRNSAGSGKGRAASPKDRARERKSE